MKKLFKWLCIALLVLVVLPVLIVVAINAFDDKLDPQAAAWGEPRASGVPEAENGFYAALALAAPDGDDGMAYAKAWVNEARAAAKENRKENFPPIKRTKRPEMCDAANVSCLAQAREKSAEIGTALEAYKENLERYEKLISSKRYEEVLDYPMRLESAIPAYADVTWAQRAYLVKAALAAESGSVEEAVAALERDIAFYRVMLTGARTLIGKMIAVSCYWRDLAFAADLLAARPADELKPLLPRFQALFAAIDPAALNLRAAFETEYMALKQFYRNVGDDPQAAGLVPGQGIPGQKFFYKPNATINQTYAVYAFMAETSAQPAGRVAQEWKKLPLSNTEMTFKHYIDNPVGNILLRVAIPSFDHYVYRLHDLEGFNRLLALRAEMMAADVAADQAGEFVAKSAARFYDPYTGKPMAWDADKKRMYFSLHGQRTADKRRYVEKNTLHISL